ncbi:MerR family transcriptional regulator [Streptomyces sp. NBC_01283]|uniref:MerR family transcriptional regulator n=1 Tax=Streptomyces sp. NBC_01283 TaxID=2903812 RepID=UPI00352DE58F|nr:MerR family transcriptional regulator [Streptomyces sp. NBC_01283]
MGSEHLQTGEVAARTELSPRTIRHYEDVGLVIPSARSQGGFRLYTEDDVARLVVIRRMKPLGFTLDEMRDLLGTTDHLECGDELAPAQREELVARMCDVAARPAGVGAHQVRHQQGLGIDGMAAHSS